MSAKSYIEAFNPEDKPTVCESCGICLQTCPVMNMSADESCAEMARLLNGEETERVLNECTFCFNCNSQCPSGLRPYALIMERLADSIQKSGKGIPSFIQYCFTGKYDSCLFWDVYETESENEKEILKKWAIVPPKSRDVLFIGCIGREIPLGIEHSQALAPLPKYSPREACCGELPFRYGDYKTFAETVERTQKLLGRLDTERLVCYCGSCANFFGNVWPNYHGVKLSLEVISIWEWLWEKVQAGELKVQREIPAKVAISDACYGSELGDRFFEAVRGLHEAVGMEVIKLSNNKYDNLTCGAISVVRRNFDMREGFKDSKTKMNQIAQSGAPDVSCYCPGCYVQLRGPVKKSGLNIRYSLEDILWALGDTSFVPFDIRAAKQSELFVKKLKEWSGAQ